VLAPDVEDVVEVGPVLVAGPLVAVVVEGPDGAPPPPAGGAELSPHAVRRTAARAKAERSRRKFITGALLLSVVAGAPNVGPTIVDGSAPLLLTQKR
jgi:hypothetical protein